MNKKAFGQRLRFLRKLEHLTQARLAEAVDITVEHLSNLERGISAPSFELIIKLAKALETTPANLFLFIPFQLLDEEEGGQTTDAALDWRGYVTRIGFFERDMLTGRSQWSDSLMEIFGLSPSVTDRNFDLILKHVLDDDRASFLDAYQRLVEDKNPPPCTFRFRRKDGLVRLGLAQAELERDENGIPVQVFGLIMDITEQKRMEQSLVATHHKMEQQVKDRTHELQNTVRRLETEARERKKAEHEASALSERLQRILNVITDGYFDHHIPSNTAYYSPSWGAMLGYEPEELGREAISWGKIVHPEDQVRIETSFQEQQQGENPPGRMENEFRLRAKDGSWRCILSRSQVVERDDQGRPLRIVGVHTDITKLKAAMAALEKSEKRLLRAHTLARMGCWELHIPTGRLWWSDNLFRLFGYEPGEEDLTMEFFLNHVHPEDVRPVLDEHARVRRDKGLYDVEYRFFRKNGTERHGRSMADVILDHKGKPVLLAGAFQDITGRRLAERECRASQERFRRIFLQAPLGMTRAGLDGTLLEVNNSFACWLGYEPEELAGMRFQEITHPDDRAENELLHLETQEQKREGYQMVKRYLRKDGSALRARVYSRRMFTTENTPCCFLAMILPLDED